MIIPVEGFKNGGETLYLIMSVRKGDTLYNRRSKIGSLEVAAELLKNLVDAIDTLHKEGYLHLDIKPQNIYWNKRNDSFLYDLRLFDFDSIRNKDEINSGNVPLLGTEGWAAPELMKSGYKDISPATDLYSIGAVFYWMLTGGDEDIKSDMDYSADSIQLLKNIKVTDDQKEAAIHILKKTLVGTPANRYQKIKSSQSDPSENLYSDICKILSEKQVLQQVADEIYHRINESRSGSQNADKAASGSDEPPNPFYDWICTNDGYFIGVLDKADRDKLKEVTVHISLTTEDRGIKWIVTELLEKIQSEDSIKDIRAWLEIMLKPYM
jgi:serine/threonine protein kinase